jgi:hypothetical protein
VDNTIKRIKFSLTIDIDTSLTKEKLYDILDQHFDELLTKDAGVSMYRYELPTLKTGARQ